MEDGRLRFMQCDLENLPDEQVRISVTLGGGDDTFTGSMTGPAADDGALWCAAEATVRALHLALNLEEGVLSLKDVVSFEINGKPAVAVSMSTRIDGRKRRLYGLCQAQENQVQSAALSVLNGSNRVYGDT